jgi:PhnB protein
MVKPIPDGYHALTPYLIVRGVPRLLEFLKSAFGAEEVRRTAMPDGTIMHAEVRIDGSALMMGEAHGEFAPMPGSIFYYVKDADAVYRRALDAGAVSLMEPADQFHGDRHGGVKDPAGNSWWIATHIEDVSREEMERRAKEFIERKANG